MFTEMVDKSAGDAVTLAMWDAIRTNLNAGVMRPVAKVVLSVAAASITFSSIPADWLDLLLVTRVTGTVAAGAGVRVNGDTGTNYHDCLGLGVGASAVTISSASATYFDVGAAPLASSLDRAAAYMWLHDYTSSNHKAVTTFVGESYSGSSSVMQGGGVYASTSPVTSLSVVATSSTFAAGSAAYLFGIAGV